jgi:large subunit ribosomal protein L4
MLKIQKYTIKGVKGEEVNLPKEFDVAVNLPLLAQAVYVYEKRGHVGLRNTKTRSEINRTTKKVYKQKGTGGARHGSRRANVFVGGGVIFGPRPLKRVLTLSDRVKIQAKFMAYTIKAKEGRMVMVTGISKIEKTKEASQFIKALEKITGAKRFTFVLSGEAKSAARCLRNLAKARIVSFKDANVYDIFTGGMIVIDEGVIGGKVKGEGQEVSKASPDKALVKEKPKAVKTVKPAKKEVVKKTAVKKVAKK